MDQPAEWKEQLDAVYEARQWADAIRRARENYNRLSDSDDAEVAQEAYEELLELETANNKRLLAMREASGG